jgi:DNA polymerase beta
MSSKNDKIIKVFKKLIRQIGFELSQPMPKKEENRSIFRLYSIRRSLRIIIKYPNEIKHGKDIGDIKGIGSGTINRIDEILKTGTLKELSSYEQVPYIVDELVKVVNIGPKTAYGLVKKYNIKSLDDFRKRVEVGEIPINDKIKLGLKYFDSYQKSIPRIEMMKMDKYLHSVLSKIDDNLFGVMCGSYRRLSLLSNDIDFMIVHPSIITMDDLEKSHLLKKIVDILHKSKFIIADLTDKNYVTKYMGFCKLENNPIRHIDIRLMPLESYYPALLHFTGSGNYNRKMRTVAIDLEMKLSEYGLFKIKKNGDEEMVNIKSEKDIFNKLGLEYVPPEERSEGK